MVEARLARLRRALKGRVELRPTSPKWAWVEYRLAQGGFAAGRAAAVAARAGARFSDWRAALAEVPLPDLDSVAPVPAPVLVGAARLRPVPVAAASSSAAAD